MDELDAIGVQKARFSETAQQLAVEERELFAEDTQIKARIGYEALLKQDIELEEKKNKLQNRKEDAEKKKEEIEKEKRTLKKKKEELDKEKEILKEKKKTLQEMKEALEAKKKSRNDQKLTKYENDLSTCKQKLSTSKRDLSKYGSALSACEEKLSASEKKLSSLVESLKLVSGELEVIGGKFDALDQGPLKDINQKFEVLNKKINDNGISPKEKKTLSKILKEEANCKEELEKIREKIRSQELKLRNLKTDEDQRTSSADSLKDDMDKIHQEIRQLSKQMKSQLEALKKQPQARGSVVRLRTSRKEITILSPSDYLSGEVYPLAFEGKKIDLSPFLRKRLSPNSIKENIAEPLKKGLDRETLDTLLERLMQLMDYSDVIFTEDSELHGLFENYVDMAIKQLPNIQSEDDLNSQQKKELRKEYEEAKREKINATIKMTKEAKIIAIVDPRFETVTRG